MSRNWHSRVDAILSLEWYELALTVLFSFVAKTSEVLVAAGLVISTANFLTDGSIMTAHPGLSTAWAWAQSISLDSSLAVCLSYTFSCLKHDAWIKGLLYAILTLLLSFVAGTITTIDIVSHALRISMDSAMGQMGINVTLLSQFRAIAVVGFILISRLRTLPLKEPKTTAEKAPRASGASATRPDHGQGVQAMIQSLCSQFTGEEVAQIINACLAARKVTPLTPFSKRGPAAPAQLMTPELQGNHQGMMAPQNGATPGPEEAGLPIHLVPGPGRAAEPSEQEPLPSVDQHWLKAPELDPTLHASALPKPVQEAQRHPVPESETPPRPEPGAELSDGAPAASPALGAPGSEETPMQREERLEQAYQSLLAEGKKPSGRALAARAHVHRSTCVEWLRTHHLEAPAQEAVAPIQGQSSPEPVDDQQELSQP